jgi:hypothetical protein
VPVDTRDKRASMMMLAKPAPRMVQNPAGVIAQPGRQFAMLCYVGILAAAPVVVTPRTIILVTYPGSTTLVTYPGTTSLATYLGETSLTTTDV